jgi:magnesium-protoporphyrin O-methyltransferase
MDTATYQQRRSQIEDYFDRTALKAWEQLTSTAPVGRIRATVRAGRDRMRATLLQWLPQDMRGQRLLDAGCGTGALAVEAARRGAQVVAIDLSAQLVDLARHRIAAMPEAEELLPRIHLCSGDMMDSSWGQFDHVVAMDSIIHYCMDDAVRLVSLWAPRTHGTISITFAPRNPLLVLMRATGRLFPRANRAPWIEPFSETQLRRSLMGASELTAWEPTRTQRISSGFYTSQALMLERRRVA